MKTAVLAASLCAIALAAGQAPAQDARTRAGGGVPHAAGGTGIASQQELKARENEFNLKLVFTLVEGNYLADVNVAVMDAAGKSVLDATADGPFFLARLPAGAYTVSASYRGVTQTRRLQLTDRLRTEYLRWPANPEVDFPGPREQGDRGPAVAVAPAAPGAAASSAVEPQTAVVADGVGEAAQSQLKAMEGQYNLKLVFTLVEGNYVADVKVAIQDARGRNVVERLVGGPMLMARLPDGAYSVTATYDGRSQSRQLKVGGRLRTEYFRWPSKPGVDFPLLPESRRE